MTRAYIVVVNWNGWRDTIECLESVLRLDYPDFRVIVCDNASGDGSIERIRSWAEGKQPVEVSPDNPLRRLSAPPVPKPVPLVEYDRAVAESGGRPDDGDARLVLVRTGANLGFAGGNNVALRYALARDDFGYAWLLNNDTVVERDALSHLVRRMEEDPAIGMCGSTLPFYDRPGTVWNRGGSIYNWWLLHSTGIDHLRPVGGPFDRADVERRMNYVSGASMLVSRRFLREIGLMCEDYFLFFEEPDWAARARGRYSLGYAPGSVVYHKVGASTAAIGARIGGRRTRALVYRNALLFSRKFHPWSLPSVFLSIQLQKVVAGVKDMLGRR